MKKAILKKALCSLMVCCQFFAFAMIAKVDNEHDTDGGMASPTFIQIKEKDGDN